MIRTTCPTAKLQSPEAVVRAYKLLTIAERAFRTMKDPTEIRPIHHHLDDRVRAHVFPCMLAYAVPYELDQSLAPLLFKRHRAAPTHRPGRPRPALARRQDQGRHRHDPDGLPAYSLTDLIADLAPSAATNSGSAAPTTPSPGPPNPPLSKPEPSNCSALNPPRQNPATPNDPNPLNHATPTASRPKTSR